MQNLVRIGRGCFRYSKKVGCSAVLLGPNAEIMAAELWANKHTQPSLPLFTARDEESSPFRGAGYQSVEGTRPSQYLSTNLLHCLSWGLHDTPDPYYSLCGC